MLTGFEGGGSPGVQSVYSGSTLRSAVPEVLVTFNEQAPCGPGKVSTPSVSTAITGHTVVLVQLTKQPPSGSGTIPAFASQTQFCEPAAGLTIQPAASGCPPISHSSAPPAMFQPLAKSM